MYMQMDADEDTGADADQMQMHRDTGRDAVTHAGIDAHAHAQTDRNRW